MGLGQTRYPKRYNNVFMHLLQGPGADSYSPVWPYALRRGKPAHVLRGYRLDMTPGACDTLLNKEYLREDVT